MCVNPKLIPDPSPSTVFLSVFGTCGLAEIFLYIKSCTYSPNHMIIHQTLTLFWQRLLLLFSCSVLSNSLQLPGLQHARFPCLHHLPELVLHHLSQSHVHWVGDAIQPSHPLLSPSPSTFNLSQHQGLFHWVGCLHQVAKLLELQLQHQSFQWIFRIDFL